MSGLTEFLLAQIAEADEKGETVSEAVRKFLERYMR